MGFLCTFLQHSNREETRIIVMIVILASPCHISFGENYLSILELAFIILECVACLSTLIRRHDNLLKWERKVFHWPNFVGNLRLDTQSAFLKATELNHGKVRTWTQTYPHDTQVISLTFCIVRLFLWRCWGYHWIVVMLWLSCNYPSVPETVLRYSYFLLKPNLLEKCCNCAA